jgi:hypothetical protein
MITIARSFTRLAVMAGFIAATLLATPDVAKGDDAPRGVWLAGLGEKTSAGSNWGRLILRDGVLTFNSSATEWQLGIADIKRASIGPSEQLVVETVTGAIHYVTILDARMTAGSPRDALKVIQKALRGPSARRE